MSAPAGVTCEAVTKHYRTASGTVHAIDGITLDVEPGSSLAVTGPSGCGKSTLLGVIGGLEEPSSGRVTVGGLEVSGMRAAERDRLRREHLGFVFQSDNLLPYLTVWENVALQLALHANGVPDERSLALLAELGLAGMQDKLPDQLSGGQRLRVAIARAVVHAPSVILADEPTGAVDSENAHLIVDLLLAVQSSSGATLIVVTHDLDVAGRLERTVALRDGRLATGTGRHRRQDG